MHLLMLSLENWRGVASRQIAFSEGVTLVEGPNEIGKSTMVEAIRLLFSELDSSKKQSVKAIQPVNRDIGSTAEVEVKSGEYHFVYSKTYNKAAQTSLNVLAPKKRQLTGREAHEAVETMLAETVDMALWEALLVNQGEKVALANIQDSAGLAKALDAAAGAVATGGDDSALYEAVRAEYERYFTLKAGKSRFAAEEAALEKAEQTFAAARKSLDEVENSGLAHERSAAEVRRISAELPRLREIAARHLSTWQTVKSLKDTLNTKNRQLADARAIQKAAVSAEKGRIELLTEISNSQSGIAGARKELEPLQQKADRFLEQTRSAQLVIADHRKQVKKANAAFDQAYADEKHILTVEKLAREETRLQQLREIAADKQSALKEAGSINVDNAALEKIREAERRAAVARGIRSTAATTVSITAEDKVVIEIDGKENSLTPSKPETRSITSALRIRFPGVAAIEVTPPQSAVDLQEELEGFEEALASLLRQFDVSSLKDAVAANERRADAQRNVERLKTREKEILDNSSIAEIEQDIASCHAESARYAEHRQSGQTLPKDRLAASERVSMARTDLSSRETALEKAQERADTLQKEYTGLDGELRIVQQNLAGLEIALADKKASLEKMRMDDADDVLAELAREASTNVEKLEREAATLNETLVQSSPDAVEALMNNARGALERAEADLIREQQKCAVLADRLEQAQADGRFEAKETAERDLEESQRTLDSIRQRAAAAELLWNTMDRHRNAARLVYVQPLKEAIERLGRIACGNSFEIELGDGWNVESRTLDGITLPFEYLSIGAKEQMGILARLAAAQIVSKHGGVPLIIDDALGFSDPSRLETIGAAIAAAGKEAQIIILTCTPGRFTHVGNAEVVRF